MKVIGEEKKDWCVLYLNGGDTDQMKKKSELQ